MFDGPPCNELLLFLDSLNWIFVTSVTLQFVRSSEGSPSERKHRRVRACDSPGRHCSEHWLQELHSPQDSEKCQTWLYDVCISQLITFM